MTPVAFKDLQLQSCIGSPTNRFQREATLQYLGSKLRRCELIPKFESQRLSRDV